VLVPGVASVRQASAGFGAPVAKGVVMGCAATALLKGKGGTVGRPATAIGEDHITAGT